MMVLVFSLDDEDAILPELRKRFPSVGFRKSSVKDDLEEEGRDLVAIVSIEGVDAVALVEDLSSVSPSRALGGSQALMTFRILKSIGSIDSAKVIAVPAGYPADKAVEEIASILESLVGRG
jgi:hypothetical protein